MTKASNNFPRSWNIGLPTNPAKGGRSCKTTIMAITRLKALKVHPITKIRPKIVEYQVGSRDIIQSTEANVTVRTNNAVPGPLTCVDNLESRRSAVRSCSMEKRFKSNVKVNQIKKKIAVRATKKPTFRYAYRASIISLASFVRSGRSSCSQGKMY